MEWIDKISRIVCLNLTKRTDRLIEFTAHMEEYQIPFERYTAIEHHNGAEGLRLTMVELFEDCLKKNLDNVLVFEDDSFFLIEPFLVHDAMNKAVDQLPENYWMLFLGCQLTGRVIGFPSPNIVKGTKMFSTHSVLYSKQGMKEILARNFYSPIDNFYVSHIEDNGNSYAIYPLLTCQRPGYSDIGKNEINWFPFIVPRYQQKINEYHAQFSRK